MPEDLAAATVAAGGAFGNLGSAATMSPAFLSPRRQHVNIFCKRRTRSCDSVRTEPVPRHRRRSSFPQQQSSLRYGSNGRVPRDLLGAFCVDELSTKEHRDTLWRCDSKLNLVGGRLMINRQAKSRSSAVGVYVQSAHTLVRALTRTPLLREIILISQCSERSCAASVKCNFLWSYTP